MRTSARWFSWIGGALLLAVVGARFGTSASLDPPDVVPVGVFSEMDSSQTLPEGWREISLAVAYNETEYELVGVDGRTAVRARSRSSASVLATERRVDLTKHPILEWDWKLGRVLEEAKVGIPDRDDYAARLIVAFENEDLPLRQRLKLVAFRALGYEIMPERMLVYGWANRAERGTVLKSTKVDWMLNVVVRNSSTAADTWVTERRNVLADYRRIFGEQPPPVSRVLLFTDTNDTNGEVTAYYGDIVFRAAPPDSATVDTFLRPKSGPVE